MRLFIQIPCFNESEQLPATLADLPRRIEGIDEICVLVIDDGSVDGTSEVARREGVHYVVRFPRNRGLAAAYAAGLEACLRHGADLIVNTDADNQYCADDIATVVAPILRGEADIVIGDRLPTQAKHFSFIKRRLQGWGSRVVSVASTVPISDATSGFRALSRKAASMLFVHNRFTYTLETAIQAGNSGLALKNVVIRTNPKTRESRLFRSIPDYLRKALPVIVRAHLMYRPVSTFASIAIACLTLGMLLIGRFLYYFFTSGGAGHVQSVVLGVGFLLLSFMVGMLALLSTLIAANRRLLEDVLLRVRQLDARLQEGGQGGTTDAIATGAEPWRSGTP